MEKELKGKVAVVTGGSKGIGKAIAKKLAQMGAKVLIISKDMQQLNIIKEEILSLGGECEAFSVDVSKKEEIRNFCDNVLSKTNVDIYVNNAGITKVVSLLESLDEDIDKIYNVNLLGPICFLQNVANQMVKQNKGGNIVIVTSINGIKPLPSQPIYSSTKAALQSLMESLAIELAPYHIRVNSVAPGATLTPMAGVLSEEDIARYSSDIPLKRFADAEEIAELVAFLTSEKSSYVTGSTFVADGGLLLRKP